MCKETFREAISVPKGTPRNASDLPNKTKNPLLLHSRIHRFSFGTEDEQIESNIIETDRLKRSLGIEDPLNGLVAHTEESNYMFQYFLKVVSTRFETLSKNVLATHQYSVTSYERDLNTGNQPVKEAGHSTSHGFAGVPGVFFSVSSGGCCLSLCIAFGSGASRLVTDGLVGGY